MAALFFDGLRNAKFSALTTDIVNQALQGKYVLPRTYDKVLKLAGRWKNKSTSTHNNNINAGVTVVQPGVLGREYQGGKGRRRGRGGRDGRGGGPGHGRDGGGRGAQKHQLKMKVQEMTTEMTRNL